LESGETLENTERDRFPIQIENEDILKLIKKANALKWIGEHYMGQYQTKIGEMWDIIAELHKIDVENHVYSMGGEIPTIYYVRPTEKVETKE
jgi:hypothetical protein